MNKKRFLTLDVQKPKISNPRARRSILLAVVVFFHLHGVRHKVIRERRQTSKVSQSAFYQRRRNYGIRYWLNIRPRIFFIFFFVFVITKYRTHIACVWLGEMIFTHSHGIEKRKKVFLGICQTRKRCGMDGAHMHPAYRRGRLVHRRVFKAAGGQDGQVT